MRIAGPGILALYSASFAVAAEDGSDQVDVTFQLLDLAGVPLELADVMVVFYVTADTAGSLAAGTALTALTCATAAQLAKSITTGQSILALTNASGQVVVRGTITGTTTRRLAAVLPDGHIVQSGTLTWAA